MKSVYPWTDRLDKSRKRNVISPRGDSKHFSAKRVQLFFNGVLKATSIYLRVLGRSRRLPWWQAQFISASVETPFTRSRRLFHLLNLTLTSAHPWLGSPAEPCSLPPLEPPETSKTLSSGLNRAVRDREPKKFKKKRKRRNLGSSNILKIFKLNIPFHRVTISYLYQYRFNLRGSSFSNQLIASLVNSHSLHDESPNKGNRLCKFFCQLW